MSDTTSRPGEISKIANGSEVEFRTTVLVMLFKHADEIKALKEGAKSVASSVDDYEDTAAQFKGGWKALGGLVTVGLAVWGLFQALAWFAEKVKP